MILLVLLFVAVFCMITAFNIGLIYLNRWSNGRLEFLHRRRT